MIDSTSTAKTFWDLMELLPKDTNWSALKDQLKERLQEGTETAPTLTYPQNRLLVGLRLRERFLVSPLYVKMQETDPFWWTGILDGVGARLAKYPTETLRGIEKWH